jgi:hypothetical protein
MATYKRKDFTKAAFNVVRAATERSTATEKKGPRKAAPKSAVLSQKRWLDAVGRVRPGIYAAARL